MKKLKIGTVFSGIGSFEQALKIKKIPHETMFACDNGEIEIEYDHNVEYNKIKKMKTKKEKKEYVENLYRTANRKTNFVEKSYLANYKIKDDMFYQDVCLLDGLDYRDQIDIFVGGSPCQSFSIAGKRAGLEDTRGTLFYEYARLVSEIQPKVFIYENVKGMLTHDKGNTWKVIKETFDSLGYKIVLQEVVNSKDHLIPQNRNRIFVIGYKDDNKEFKKLTKHKLPWVMQDFLLDNCKLGNFTYKDEKPYIKKSKGEYDPKYFLSDKLYNYVMCPGTKNFKSKPEIDLPIARTLLKTMGNRHRAGVDNYVTVNGKVRMLTEREAHRLMGFPDSYKIVVSRSQAYRQAGNSIVVPVFIDILNSIIEVEDL